MLSTVQVRVPAKINLLLRVGPPRDGFHPLQTVFHAVDLYDEITASPADTLSLEVVGDDADQVPVDETNLAWRAAALLASATGVEPRVHLRIDKRIPVAGGMAGGSADAAGALVACARLWDVEADLPALAAQLGSDVAFPLLGGNAHGQGRGEILTPLADGPTLHWVLALADHGIPAAAAYAEFDRRRPDAVDPTPDAIEPLVTALASGDVDAIASAMGNDLQPAAAGLAPALGHTLMAGIDSGAVAGLVSGSGPTCAFLCRSEMHTPKVAKRLAEFGRVVVASGPVAGATIV
ncbi:MAG: 4-(cytidine 5'-diphospho)-2-C-methyl-D-erythritol kinase [Jatrophihabitans sp.]|uniref:4-(cytidine 5'-diphospho)-2-C-methyl-D-erythritol kinase n=1 Tax=Jatrophihabitans sp. TaxID=1932789 RepID=UPI003F81FE73